MGVFIKKHTTRIISEEKRSSKNLSSRFHKIFFLILLFFFFVSAFSLSLAFGCFFGPVAMCFLRKKFIHLLVQRTRRELEMKRILKQVLDNSKSSLSLTSSRSEVVLVGGFRRTTFVTPTVAAARGVSSAFTRSSSRVGKNPSRLLRRRRRFRRSMGTTMKLQTPRVVHQRRKTSTRPNSIRTRK